MICQCPSVVVVVVMVVGVRLSHLRILLECWKKAGNVP